MNWTLTRAEFDSLPFREDVTTYPLPHQPYRSYRDHYEHPTVYIASFNDEKRHDRFVWWRFTATLRE